ncbi:MAG TPA: serine/threonine-protein kinase [Archangium sp.]|uniref:serine/threonine-protein kinase n=1 Tax=Archangium sp. TaxID=1872627 RepID=UPI002E32D0F3|nr:serine/threonine-protein kinase [Archangium sp.]HEX5751965.1 serine/threonine-protein kinase [Archangium sp.]
MSSQRSEPPPLELAAVALAPGTVVAGRYTLLQPLGQGGMGVVLAAYDAKLDRRVALKLLHDKGPGDAAGRSRLLREAQAMARLSHPHVVQVYDTGELDTGQLFIAMECVEGATLRHWCLAEPRTWREVVGAYLEAGRGLAAAHAVGLVHRDFKPENVLVGRDGRVRVTDFGVVLGEHASPGAPLPSASEPSAWEQSLTQPGSVMGTLRYMAPELMTGQPADARSDLFAFCVALYEALYRQPPYGGHTLEERAAAFARASGPAPAPTPSEVPAWVERALLQGLSLHPDLRCASMHQLLKSLESDPLARRRARLRAAALGSLVVGLAGLAVGGWLRGEGREPPCAHPERRLAGVWDAHVRQQVEQALVATGVDYAPDTYRRVAEALDAYAGQWAGLSQEVCEAERGQSVLPRSVVTPRALCLERRRNQLGSLTQLLSQGVDKALVERAVHAARSLPPLGYCQDDKALLAVVPPPEDPAVRAQVESLQAQVDRLGALLAAGRYAQGAQLAEALLPQVARVDHAPLRARTLYEAAQLEDSLADPAAAEALVRQALPLAARGGDDVLVAECWILLFKLVGDRQGRHQEALGLRLALETAVEQAGDEVVRANALNNLGNLHIVLGRHEEALELHTRALAIREKTLGPRHLHVAMSLNNLALLLRLRGRHEEALAMRQRVLSIREETQGPEHPEVAKALSNLGLSLFDQGSYAQARGLLERALALQEKQLGPENVDLGNNLNNLGITLMSLGEIPRAHDVFQRALTLREKALGPEHPFIALSLDNMGAVLLEQGHPAQARAVFERARAMHEKVEGPEHPHLIETLVGLGWSQVRLGQYEAARRPFERALALAKKTLTPEDPGWAEVLQPLGEWHLARGRPAEAVSVLERALALAQVHTNARAEVQFSLARALWSLGSQRPRAHTLASEAREHYQRLGHAPRLARISQWLDTHPRP